MPVEIFNKNAMPTGRQGFTLVELLVTIAIMATLMAILLPNFMGARERARDAQKIQDMDAVKAALRLYYNDNQKYPLTLADPGLSTYMNNISGLGYTYAPANNNDSFIICSVLDSGQGSDDTDSLTKCSFGDATFRTVPMCGVAAGSVGDKVFAVCAR